MSVFSSISFTTQQQQNVTTALEKSEENTPILINFVNETFPYASESTNIIASGLKTLFGFNQNTRNKSYDTSINASANPKDDHELLQESHEFLKTMDNV